VSAQCPERRKADRYSSPAARKIRRKLLAGAPLREPVKLEPRVQDRSVRPRGRAERVVISDWPTATFPAVRPCWFGWLPVLHVLISHDRRLAENGLSVKPLKAGMKHGQLESYLSSATCGSRALRNGRARRGSTIESSPYASRGSACRARTGRDGKCCCSRKTRSFQSR
jgi:hypothetical protein